MQSQFNRFKESKESWEDQFNPKCETDQEFRRNEDALLDEACKDVVYVTIPKPILSNIITPAKRVHELHDSYVREHIKESWLDPNLASELLQQFKNRNDRYIGLLAKEFEMRKAARSFSNNFFCVGHARSLDLLLYIFMFYCFFQFGISCLFVVLLACPEMNIDDTGCLWQNI